MCAALLAHRWGHLQRILVNRKCYTECLCLESRGWGLYGIRDTGSSLNDVILDFLHQIKHVLNDGMRLYNCMHPTNHRRPVHSSVCGA